MAVRVSAPIDIPFDVLHDVLRIFGNFDTGIPMTEANGRAMERFVDVIPGVLDILDTGGIPGNHRTILVHLVNHLMAFRHVCYFRAQMDRARHVGDARHAALAGQAARHYMSLLEAQRDAFQEGASIFAAYADAIMRTFFVAPDPVVVPVRSDFWETKTTLVTKVPKGAICSICLEPCKDGDTTRLQCYHDFCTHCIKQYIETVKHSCPNCRSDPRDGVKPSPDPQEGGAELVNDLTGDDAATNRTGSPISVGDTVTVSSGKYRDRKGVVIGVSRKNRLKLRFENGESTPRASIKPSQVQRA